MIYNINGIYLLRNKSPTKSQTTMNLNSTEGEYQINKQQLKRWIACLVLVTFDLDQGQKIQHIVPELQLSEQSRKEIAMLSFPDSNSFNDYQNSFKYTFRLFNGVFGYVCFKQKKDPKNPRGFSQRSLVVLSQLPFVDFFEKLTQFIVFKTFNSVSNEEFPNVMARICSQISRWPDPSPKSEYILPILQYQLAISIPNYKYSSIKSHTLLDKKLESPKLQAQLAQTKKQFNLQNILTQQQLLREGPFQEIKLSQVFISFHQILWPIWESVILNRSILLLGSNPQQVSHAVLGAISLLYPFEYSGHFNPYVTVYDPNLQKISSEPKNWISGGTNPLFEKFFPKEITQIICLKSNYKFPKHLKPLKQLIIKSKATEEQQAINESALRKYFYKLSRSVMLILDQYFTQQVNDLKFFNDTQFLKWVKERKDYLGFEEVFTNKKYVLQFFQQFVNTSNFNQYLISKNAIKIKNK